MELSACVAAPAMFVFNSSETQLLHKRRHIMLKALVSLALLFIIPVTSWAQVIKELVGKYRMDVKGGDTLELRAGGTASLPVANQNRGFQWNRPSPAIETTLQE